jgi:drug/metabolite transporter (DMT)-like permease
MTSRSAASADRGSPAAGPRPLLVAAALGIVYVVWGSTYLAIRIMVEQMPPLLAAGARYVAAAAVLGGLIALRHGVRRILVSRRQLAACSVVGLLLPAGGNGLVTVGEGMAVPSGLAALLIASVPLWVVVLRSGTGDRPVGATVGGVLLGFCGLFGLVVATGLHGGISLPGLLLIVVAAMSWSLGSWSQPRIGLPADPFVATVYEMLAGGLALLVAGAVRGESVHLGSYSTGPVLAWVYLVTFGSLLAFTAYVWVLQAAPISLVATYAYVNPVVAVFLGWFFVGEPVTLPIVVAGGVVLLAVAIVVSSERPRQKPGVHFSDEHG